MNAKNIHSMCRQVLMAVHVSLALLVLGALPPLGASDAADSPASPAQLQRLRDQIAGLQGQLAATQTALQALDRQIADINVKLFGGGAAQDLFGNFLTTRQSIGLSVSKPALQVQLTAAQTQRDAAAQRVASLQQKIAQLQATLNYLKDPLAADLENERAGLRNLQNQKPTSDDQGHIQWDIDSRMRRIKELEEEFQRQQQGGGGGTTGQSAQPQGQSYTTPTQGYGTGDPAGQSPPMGPGSGYPGGPGVTPPRHPGDTLVGPSGGEGDHPHPGGSSGGGSPGGKPKPKPGGG